MTKETGLIKVWCLDGTLCSPDQRQRELTRFIQHRAPVMTCLADVCHGGQAAIPATPVPPVRQCKVAHFPGEIRQWTSRLYTPWTSMPSSPTPRSPFRQTHRRVPYHIAHVHSQREPEVRESFSPSDQQLKKDIQDVDKTDWDRMSQLKPKKYKWKFPPKESEKDREIYGFIAQDIQSIYPQMVRKEDKYLSVDYQQMIPLLVDRVNALQQQVKPDQLCIGNTCISHKEMVAIKQM